jgi:hypothetical protein
MYFVINKDNAKILSHYETKPDFGFDGAIVAELTNITINETVIDWGNNQTSIQYSYTPDAVDLVGFKKAVINEIQSQPIAVSEVTLANGLVFDDTEKSMAYLQAKRNTSNSQEVVYDKYNTSATMSNSELTAAVSVIATSQMSKDDAYKAKVVEINNAESIEQVKDLVEIYQEKTIKLIVDVDGANFDSTNQVTNESLNQVVMADGGVDLSAISWINAIGVKSINGQTEFVEVIDSNFVNTAQIALSQESPIINGIIKADGLPVELEMVVYCM